MFASDPDRARRAQARGRGLERRSGHGFRGRGGKATSRTERWLERSSDREAPPENRRTAVARPVPGRERESWLAGADPAAYVESLMAGIEDYELGPELGRGGMGAVFRARHRPTG